MVAQETTWAIAAKNGDRRAFEALHVRYARMVHGIVLASLSPFDAEDGVQEVFLAAWRRIEGLENPAAVGGWLASIARNYATDHARTRKRRRPIDAALATWDSGLAWIGLGAISGAEARLDAHRVVSVIQRLPEAYRETLTLRLVTEMTGEEIAEQTGLSPGSVRVNLHRGMALLREQLSEPTETELQLRTRAVRWGSIGRQRKAAKRVATTVVGLLMAASIGIYRWGRPSVEAWTWLDGDGACISEDCRLDPGEWANGTGQVALERLGRAALGPDTQLRRDSLASDRVELTLEKGPLFIAFNGEPRQLVIHTPAADVVDLGCAFNVEVSSDQTTVLVVQQGVVALENPTRTVRVPAGAAAVARLSAGPGTPVFLDSSKDFGNAVDRFDLGGEDLDSVLRAAQRKDTLTLWNLLASVSAEQRAPVIDRMFELEPRLVAKDPTVNAQLRSALQANDPQAVEEVWATLKEAWAR